MSEPRFASLSSGLLARKGAAKPAMRPAAFGQVGAGLDDLGWNDMGQPAPVFEERQPSSITALTPAPRAVEEVPPPVLEQQRAIAASFHSEPAPQPAPSHEPEPASIETAPPVRPAAPVVQLPRKPREAPAKAKAAFTLRLDADRHLRLRLASAVAARSAQLIVTEALDEYLNARPELDTLAAQVPASAGRH